MIEHTEIKMENGEEVLYCYLSYDYEFGKEFFSNIKEKGIIKQIQDWMHKRKIAFHGKKVVVVASGIVVASLLWNTPPLETTHSFPSFSKTIVELVSKEPVKEAWNNGGEVQEELPPMVENQQETPSDSITQAPIVSTPSSTPQQVSVPEAPSQSVVEEPVDLPAVPVMENPITIYRNGTPVVLEFEDYIAGVVAAEMPASFHSSALQAQAVLARTYALRRIQEGKRLTDSTDTQVYYDEGQLRREWGSAYETYYNKVKEACLSTKGQTLKYQGNYIDAVYHSTSNGKTEAARNVWGYEIPYLQSVDSHWDYNTTFYQHTVSKDLNQLLQLFNVVNLEEGDFEILSRNESGRVSEIRIQNQTYQGVDLRSILGLRSSDFDLTIENGNLVITTRGWGHGVGLSQYGANGMAREGSSYSQILSHYYPGTYLG